MNELNTSSRGRTDSSATGQTGYTNWKQWPEGEFGKCSPLEAAFFDAEVAPLLQRGSAEWRVLEIGFGNGPFLGWCSRRAIFYCGVEIEPAMRARARSSGIMVTDSIFDPQLSKMSGSFDLIAAFDVIEHIEQSQLEPVFVRVERLLRSGGHFVAKFPNGDSPFGRINQHGDLTHVTTLGRGKIHHLASLSQLEVVSIADPKRPWKNVGMRNSVRRLLGGVVKSGLEGLIRTLYFGGERISFDRNAVAILRK